MRLHGQDPMLHPDINEPKPWLVYVTPIRATDIRDYGLVYEPAIEVLDLDDLDDLYAGIDMHGVAI